MKDIEKYLKEKIREAVAEAGYDQDTLPSIDVSGEKIKGHGDLSTNVAFILASKAGIKRIQAAESLVDAMHLDGDLVTDVTVAGPGFINFTLSATFYHEAMQEILTLKEKFGRADWGGAKKTQVEFVSANPTGPLTVGHGRQAVLGDTIARLMEATGHNVTREYYFNDAGRQMRVLGDSVRLRYRELLGEKAEFPDDYYQGQYICEIAQMAFDAKGDSLKDSDDVEYFTSLAEEVIFKDIKHTISRLDIKFDMYYNEKSLYETGKIESLLKLLKDKDFSYEKDGAIWFRTTRFGKESDRVIVKSSGEPTYRLPDIAYHIDKMERGFEFVIDIFGADHVATYPDVLAGLEAVGYDRSRVKVLIHQFVTLMEGKEKIKMSTRKANFVTLDELIDEVGTDVTRYFFLNRSMSAHLNFDLSLAKTQSDENPVFYVQYAHARICSIIRHAKKQGIDPESDADISLLKAPEEINLIKSLLLYPQIVEVSARKFEPHRIPSYLEEVATIYHRFQHAGKRDSGLRVVTEDIPMTMARLALCRATRIVLADGLSLLGISRPEKM